jgi:KaiC/GvpD/RAD55 family RecA-like ATPase
MFPNLLESTKEYWQKLDTLEAAYQRGDVSLDEVNVQAAELMRELGRKRRLAISTAWNSIQHWLKMQKEAVLGLVMVSLVAYIWVLSNLMS